jgi:hypothetical protein
MHRHLSLRLTLAGLCTALVAAGCGGSSALTGPEEPAPSASARGAAILQGAILGTGISSVSTGAPVRALAGDTGWSVSIVGTALTAEVDGDGHFLLSGAPSGSARLRIDGPGVSAQVDVTGLVNGQVTSIEVQVTGDQAKVVTAMCTPTAETSFSGVLEKMTGTKLVVSGRNVDASQNKKVWRGDRRIDLSELIVGEKVKVIGVVGGDGAVVSEEIAALTSGPGPDSETYVTFSGRVDSVGESSSGAEGNLGASCTSKYPTLWVKQTIVIVNSDTKVKQDGRVVEASEIKVGQGVTVEGWKQANGAVRATLIVIG